MTFKLPKPQYTKLRNLCKRNIDSQYANHGYVNFNLCSFNGILMYNQDIRVPYHHVDHMLAHIASDLGLVDDGTNTQSYTMPGREMPELPLLREYAKNRQLWEKIKKRS